MDTNARPNSLALLCITLATVTAFLLVTSARADVLCVRKAQKVAKNGSLNLSSAFVNATDQCPKGFSVLINNAASARGGTIQGVFHHYGPPCPAESTVKATLRIPGTIFEAQAASDGSFRF